MISYYEETRRLFNVTANGHLDEMKSAIESKADPNAKIDFSTSYRQIVFKDMVLYPSNQNSLLHAAVLSNSVEIIQYVMNDLGIDDLNRQDCHGFVSLEIAISSNKLNSVQHLIQQFGLGSYYQFRKIRNLNRLNGEFPNLMTLAVLTQSTDMIYFFINIISSESKDVPFRAAIYCAELGHFQLFKAITESYAIPPDKYMEYVHYVYSWANLLQSQSIEVIDYLNQYTNGAIFLSYDLKQPSHTRILGHIIQFSLFKIAKHLLEKVFMDVQIDFNRVLNALAQNYQTPIELFSYVLGLAKQHIMDITSILINIACTAAKFGNFPILTNLIEEYNVDPYLIKDDKNNNIYHIVSQTTHCTRSHIDYIHQLGLNIDVNAQNTDGWTPLHNAIHYQCNLLVILSLFVIGADLTLCIQNKDFASSLSKSSSPPIILDMLKRISDPQFRQSIFNIAMNYYHPNDFILDALSCTEGNPPGLVTLEHIKRAVQSTSPQPPEQCNCLRVLDALISMYNPLHLIEKINDDTKLTEQQRANEKKEIESQQYNILAQMVERRWINVRNVKKWIDMHKIDVTVIHDVEDPQTLLHIIASSTRSIPIFDLIMSYYKDHNVLNFINYQSFTPLLVLLNDKDALSGPNATDTIDFILHILNTYKKIDLSLFCFAESIVHLATYTQDTRFMLKLIQLKANINCCNERLSDVQTPLFTTVIHDNLPVTLLLLQHKADVYHTDDSGQFHLFPLIFNTKGFEPVQELILDNLKSERKGSNLVMKIATSIMNAVLLSATLIPNVRMKYFQSLIEMKVRLFFHVNINPLVLHHQARQGDIDMVLKLIEAGIPLNIQTTDGGTPLLIAYQQNNYPMFKRLIQAKANVNIFVPTQRPHDHDYNGNDNTLLHSILKNEQDCDDDTIIDLCTYIITNGVNINIPNVFQELPIHTALRSPRLNVVSNIVPLILNHNADLSTTDGDGDLPIHIAARCHLNEVFTAVLHKTPQHLLDQHNYNDINAFYIAFDEGCSINLRKLLNHGIDVTKIDTISRNVLHQILYINHEDRDEEDNGDDDNNNGENNNQNDMDGNDDDNGENNIDVGEAAGNVQIDENDNNNNNNNNNHNNNFNQEPGFFHDDDFEFEFDGDDEHNVEQNDESEDNGQYDFDGEDEYIADIIDAIIESFIHFKLFENEIICNCQAYDVYNIDEDGNDAMNNGDSESDNSENEAQDQIDDENNDENNVLVDGHMGE